MPHAPHNPTLETVLKCTKSAHTWRNRHVAYSITINRRNSSQFHRLQKEILQVKSNKNGFEETDVKLVEESRAMRRTRNGCEWHFKSQYIYVGVTCQISRNSLRVILGFAYQHVLTYFLRLTLLDEQKLLGGKVKRKITNNTKMRNRSTVYTFNRYLTLSLSDRLTWISDSCKACDCICCSRTHFFPIGFVHALTISLQELKQLFCFKQHTQKNDWKGGGSPEASRINQHCSRE